MAQNSGKYIPITVDWSAPKRHERNTLDGKWCRFLLRIQKATGLTLVGCDTTINDQINKQLNLRKKFPIEEWEKGFDDVRKIRKVLKEISIYTDRVNHNYIPSDLLYYALWDDIFGEGALITELIVKDIYEIQYYAEDIIKMAKQNITLEVFFREIIKRWTMSPLGLSSQAKKS